MLKAAYFSFIAALAATPLQLIVGNDHTAAILIGLFVVAAVCTFVGLRRRP
jgi:urea transporter